MYRHVRVLGQQVNPLLTVLPLGVLGSGVLFDLGALISGSGFFARLAYWDLGVGLLVGLVSLSVLLVDHVTAAPDSRPRRLLGAVSAASSAMLILFAMVWSLRADSRPAGNVGLYLVELAALAAGIAGAWLARGLGIEATQPPAARLPLATARTVMLDTVMLDTLRLEPVALPVPRPAATYRGLPVVPPVTRFGGSRAVPPVATPGGGRVVSRVTAPGSVPAALPVMTFGQVPVAVTTPGPVPVTVPGPLSPFADLSR